MLDSRRVLVGAPSTKPQTHVFWLGPPAPNHRRTCFGWDPQQRYKTHLKLSMCSHNCSISFNNISNIIRYLYEKPPHNNRKCGQRYGTPAPVHNTSQIQIWVPFCKRGAMLQFVFYWPVNTMWRKLFYWRRVLAPAPKVLGSDIKTHLKSRFCLQAILKKRGAMLQFVFYWPPVYKEPPR